MLEREIRRLLERKKAQAVRQGERQRARAFARRNRRDDLNQPPVRLIYSVALGTLRRGVVFDTYEEMSDPALNAGPGEAQIDIARAQYQAIGEAARRGQSSPPEALQAIINAHTGRKAKWGIDDRFAVIHEGGAVIGALLGDPACGFEGAEIEHPTHGRLRLSHHTHRFVHHPEAEVGWYFHDERGFIAPPRAEDDEA